MNIKKWFQIKSKNLNIILTLVLFALISIKYNYSKAYSTAEILKGFDKAGSECSLSAFYEKTITSSKESSTLKRKVNLFIEDVEIKNLDLLLSPNGLLFSDSAIFVASPVEIKTLDPNVKPGLFDVWKQMIKGRVQVSYPVKNKKITGFDVILQVGVLGNKYLSCRF